MLAFCGRRFQQFAQPFCLSCADPLWRGRFPLPLLHRIKQYGQTGEQERTKHKANARHIAVGKSIEADQMTRLSNTHALYSEVLDILWQLTDVPVGRIYATSSHAGEMPGCKHKTRNNNGTITW